MLVPTGRTKTNRGAGSASLTLAPEAFRREKDLDTDWAAEELSAQLPVGPSTEGEDS